MASSTRRSGVQRAESEEGRRIFLRGAGSPSDRNVIDLYFDGGLVFAGMVPGRPDDSFGFGLAYARISNAARDFDADDIAINGTLAPVRDYEAAFEANYAAQIVAGWMVDLDFQYIWHPGGNVANSLRDDGTAIKDERCSRCIPRSSTERYEHRDAGETGVSPRLLLGQCCAALVCGPGVVSGFAAIAGAGVVSCFAGAPFFCVAAACFCAAAACAAAIC